MIHRFIDLPPSTVLEPNIVFLAKEESPLSYFDIWKGGNLATPARFSQTIISSLNGLNDYLGDPELSPDGTLVVYSRAGSNTTPNQNRIYVVDWNDTASTQIISESGGTIASLQPTWKPDGTKILYRGKGSGATIDSIKVCDPDGTNGSTLYTGAATVDNPQWNFDGTKIAWVESGALKVMDADGSNVSTLYNTTTVNVFPAWARTQNVIAFQTQDSSIYTDDRYWRKINADGTGLTQLLKIERGIGYGPDNVDPYAITWTWLPDDTAILTTLQTPSDPSPNHYLAYIAADGSGESFPVVKASPEGTPDFRPVVFATRIYFGTASPFTELSSVDLTGGDERVDFDGTSFSATVTFHGFRGDTINV